MTIWRTAPVGEEPIIDLIFWSIWRTERSEIHLVGIRPESMTGRVSSALSSIDATSRNAITQSGREYRLIGPPGHHDDASYVWERWCVINSVLRAIDVTTDMLVCSNDGSAIASSEGDRDDSL
jgi:hypothetical protein